MVRRVHRIGSESPSVDRAVGPIRDLANELADVVDGLDWRVVIEHVNRSEHSVEKNADAVLLLVDTTIAHAIYLPRVVDVARKVVYVADSKGTGAATNNVTVRPSAGDTIGRAASLVVNITRELVMLVADGESNWVVGRSVAGAPGTLTSSAPVDVTNAAAAVGTSTEAARADHKHDISFGAPGNIAPDDTAAGGSASSVALSDHVHGITCAVAGATAIGDTAAEGSASSFARSDHRHSVAAGTPGSVAPDDTAAAGSAATFARSDHTHGITCAAPGSIAPDDSAAEGAATSFARSDHTHAITCAVPLSVDGAQASAVEGAATSFARSDHSHHVGALGSNMAYGIIVAVNFTAGGGHAADDITIFNADCPYKLRVVDTLLVVITTGASGVATLRDASGGAGNALSAGLSIAAAARVRDTFANTLEVAAGGSMYLRRGDNDCAGWVFVTVIRVP